MTFFKFARISRRQEPMVIFKKYCDYLKSIDDVKKSLKIKFMGGLSNAINFRNMIILSFRDRYVH